METEKELIQVTPREKPPREWVLLSHYSNDNDAMKWSVSLDSEITHVVDSSERIRVVEYSALERANARIAELSIKLHEANMSLPMTNTGWPHESKLADKLTLAEKKLTRALAAINEIWHNHFLERF